MNLDSYKTKEIDPIDAQTIFEHIRKSLIDAALPSYRSTVERVGQNVKLPTETKILGKVLAKILGPFRTQVCGGFVTNPKISQKTIEDKFLEELGEFDGLICGIEASTNTVLQQKEQSRNWIQL